MVSRRGFITAAAAVAASGGLAACAKKASNSGSSGTGASAGAKKVTLGFSQVGAESGWRTANTKSIQESAAAAGFTLKFSDAQQHQENQISAIRSFIQQKVDVISFSPVVVTGWDTVLKEAKAAKIPVILTDRAVQTDDPSLYVTLVGSDFKAEGVRAGHMLEKVLGTSGAKANIAQLEGTTGSAPAIERTKGFAEVLATHPEWKIVVTQTGDFTRAGGKQVMQAFLQSHKDINVLFAQNDDMGLGAIQSIEAAGKKPGTDIKIVTVDAVHDGFVAMAAGKINGLVECNPLLGPQLMETINTVLAGGTVDKWIVTKESDFTQDQAASVLPTRKY
jgi:ABC-type sugar transport system substrate-binding protein